MRKATRFHSAPGEMFAGTLTLMLAAAIGAFALLRASAGYPGAWLTLGILIAAGLLGAASLWYLANSRALLRIGVGGIAHVPLGGKARRFAWAEIGSLRTAPGWLSVLDQRGRSLCCYTYNHTRHATLVALLAHYRSMSTAAAATTTNSSRQTRLPRTSSKTTRGARPAAGRGSPRNAKGTKSRSSGTGGPTSRVG